MVLTSASPLCAMNPPSWITGTARGSCRDRPAEVESSMPRLRYFSCQSWQCKHPTSAGLAQLRFLLAHALGKLLAMLKQVLAVKLQ